MGRVRFKDQTNALWQGFWTLRRYGSSSVCCLDTQVQSKENVRYETSKGERKDVHIIFLIHSSDLEVHEVIVGMEFE